MAGDIQVNRIPVSQSVLRWAIERSGKSADALSARFPKLQMWLSGDDQPTLKQLEAFAKTTLTPFGYLFLNSPPREILPIPLFRSGSSQTATSLSPDLLETVYSMQGRQDWMRDYLLEQESDPLAFVSSEQIDDDPLDIASRMRDILGFTPDWASSSKSWSAALERFSTALENAGILVTIAGIVENNTHRKLNPKEFRGFALVDEYAPLVFVNGADFKAAQMFTLAHEFAHLLFGFSAAFDLKKLVPANHPIERHCDKVAAEFLVPEEALLSTWGSVQNNPDRFGRLASNFRVSEIVAARRALDLELVSRNEFFDYYESRSEYYSTQTSRGGNFYNNQRWRIGRRFALAISNAIREGKLLYSEAHRLTGLRGNTLDIYLSRLETRTN